MLSLILLGQKTKNMAMDVETIGEVFYVILNSAIVYYLRGPNVKAFFGKSSL